MAAVINELFCICSQSLTGVSLITVERCEPPNRTDMTRKWSPSNVHAYLKLVLKRA